MKYYIEVYVDSEDTPDFVEDGGSPYPVPGVGDLIHPGWKIAARENGYYPGDKVLIRRVEHIIWAQSHKLMIFGEYRPGPQNPLAN